MSPQPTDVMVVLQRSQAATERIVALLKVRFPNLTAEETIKLAHQIVLEVVGVLG